MRSGRAQAGIEFTVCIIFLIMIVTILTIYAGSKQTEESYIESKLGSEQICWQVSNLINTAMYANGYYAEFSLPAKIDGSNYNLSVNNGTVVVDYLGSSCIYEISVTNISFGNTHTPFYNLSCGGDFYINNTNDQLFIWENNRSPSCYNYPLCLKQVLC